MKSKLVKGVHNFFRLPVFEKILLLFVKYFYWLFGFEKKFLEDSIKILERDKPALFIELDDELLRSNKSPGIELVSFLKNYQYKIIHAGTWEEIRKEEHVVNCHFDIICQ
ncbi:MAG: hypothetical protein H7Y86_08150 [Rhizobacter sp.]|nr:hypothetical protein [Ferruginibacter sp.]